MAMEGTSRHPVVQPSAPLSPVTALPPSYALRPREAAKFLSISERTLRELLSTGKIPYAKLERAVLIPVKELEKFIDLRTVGGDD